MNIHRTKSQIGLDGVPAAETVLSHVDGAGGRLIVRGFELEEIAERSFEAVVALLWSGLTLHPVTEEAVRSALGAASSRSSWRTRSRTWSPSRAGRITSRSWRS